MLRTLPRLGSSSGGLVTTKPNITFLGGCCALYLVWQVFLMSVLALIMTTSYVR